MFLKDISFLTPTSELKELMILELIENNCSLTQKELAKTINAAPSMINNYIKQLEEQHYLIKKTKSSRDKFYIITQKGIDRKNYLLMTYLYELLQLYNLAKHNFDTVFSKIEEKGHYSILLYGAGEVGQTVISLIKGRNKPKLEIVAILDDDVKKHGNALDVYRIVNPSDIDICKYLILITSYSYEEEIREKLYELNFPQENIFSLFRK